MKKIFTIILFLIGACIQSKGQGLVINEVDYDQPSVDSAEFIELYNSGSTPINIGTYRVVLFNGNGAGSLYDSIALPNQVLNAGSFFVICANGSVPLCDMVHAPATNMIQNGSPDAIVIRDTATGNIIDAVSYEGNCPVPYIEGNGVPLAQSDTGNTPYISIGRFPDGADTGDDSTDFHRACTTPGTANSNTTVGCQNPTGIRSASAVATLEIYPNPSTGFVTITSGQSKNVSVIVNNILGNEMKNVTVKNYDNRHQLNLSELQDGIYFVKVKTDSGESVHRIILKR